MEEMHNDSIDIKKGTNLLFRLLEYAKPYVGILILAVIAMLVGSFLDLLRPYLIKTAIDDYLTGYTAPLVQSEEAGSSLAYRGNFYRLAADDEEGTKYNLIAHEDGYYFGEVDSPLTEREKVNKEEYNIFRAKDIAGLKRIALVFFITIFGVFVFAILQEYIISVTGQKIIFKIREDVFRHIESRSVAYFDKNPVGRLVTRVTNDIENLNDMFTSVLVSSLSDIFIILGVIIIMLSQNVFLTLISLIVLPIILVAALVFRKRVRIVYREGRAVLAKINSSLNENIMGMKTIQVFKKEDLIYERFDRDNSRYLQLNRAEVRANAMFGPTVEILRSLSIAALIYIGGGEVLRGQIPFGVLYMFTEYVGKLFKPILDLTEKYGILQSALSSSERIFTILDDNQMIENTDEPVSMANLQGKIEFKDVSFAYEGENYVLKDLNFTINPGEKVAFVGETGAGKSSIINLITRFYECQKGEILIDGVNIKDYDKFELRKNIGTVLQDVFLFSGTISDNIRLGDKTISDEEVKKAAEFVNASHFIERLPYKYEEVINESGATISNGERQLLSFARTLAKEPKILILDEATSNIDTETEVLIQDALKKIMEGRTSIAIAHRLSTIYHSDKIIVIHRGRLAEEGTHRELIQKDGIYSKLYKLQYKEEE